MSTSAVTAMPAVRGEGAHPPDEESRIHRAGFEKRAPAPPPNVVGMTIALQYCHITVNDLDESLAFYRDALGLDVRNDVSSGGFRWVTLGSATQPEARHRALRTARRPLPGRTATPSRSCSPKASCP